MTNGQIRVGLDKIQKGLDKLGNASNRIKHISKKESSKLTDAFYNVQGLILRMNMATKSKVVFDEFFKIRDGGL